MLLQQFRVEGLGHLSTMITDESTGLAVVVDPRRDVDAYLGLAAELDVRISHVLETHLHNDYVSGGRELSSLTGAEHVIGAGADLAHEHRPVRDGEPIDVGALRFVALETPGHTPEHICYALIDRSRAAEPVLLLTGGSLLVGAVGRTDLLGQATARDYAAAMFRSLHEVILPHRDEVGVYPTHGAGSLCSTGISSTSTTTIGFERRHNPMLRPSEVETFARVLLGGQPDVPRYFARMRPTNQAGPRLLGGRLPDPRPLEPAAVRDALDGGARLIDTRSGAAHAVAAVPGSISIPAGSSFGTWLGWIEEPDVPLILLMDGPAAWDDLVRQALRIGYEHVIGHVRGGLGAWADAGMPLASSPGMTIDDLASRLRMGDPGPLVIDVRQPEEYASGHVPGSLHLSAGSLPERLDELPRDRPLATICASGYRSAVAASLLRRAGFRDVAWVSSGVPAWAARGYPLDVGDPPDDQAPVPNGADDGHRHPA